MPNGPGRSVFEKKYADVFVVQIAAVSYGNGPVVFALHSDGSIYKWSEWDGEAAGQWTKLPPIPDDAGPVKSPPYVPPGKRLL